MSSTPLNVLLLRKVKSLNHFFQPCFFGPPSATDPCPAILIDVGPANVKAERALRDMAACEAQAVRLEMHNIGFAVVNR